MAKVYTFRIDKSRQVAYRRQDPWHMKGSRGQTISASTINLMMLLLMLGVSSAAQYDNVRIQVV